LECKKDNDHYGSIYELAKPWVITKPVLDIAVTTRDTYSRFLEDEQPAFDEWFAPYRDPWCQHWGIPDWQPWEMLAKIEIGSIDDMDLLYSKFKQCDYPVRLKI
jgi:hypothetical protein